MLHALTDEIVLLQLYWLLFKSSKSDSWYGIVSCVFTVVLKPQMQPEVANVYIQYKLYSILLPAISAVK